MHYHIKCSENFTRTSKSQEHAFNVKFQDQPRVKHNQDPYNQPYVEQQVQEFSNNSKTSCRTMLKYPQNKSVFSTEENIMNSWHSSISVGKTSSVIPLRGPAFHPLQSTYPFVFSSKCQCHLVLFYF